MEVGVSSLALLPKCLEPGIQLIREKKYNPNMEAYLENISLYSEFELLFLNWMYESLKYAQSNEFAFLEITFENPLNVRAEVKQGLINMCQAFSINKTVHAPFLHVNLISVDDYLKRDFGARIY